MNSADLRTSFLNFFQTKGHEIVSSSSLVPGNDPTLLFTNAGMVQFKDVFTGEDKRGYSRATTSQRCVRAGGKHNDLENVGYTARHHTFFEMLGNFSFGDYFKEEAIQYAWEFLTSKDYMAIPEEKLLVTVYADDEEAFDLWHKKMGLASSKIIRIGDNKGERYASDNFWAMGDTGPCGPCSEIFYDHGADIWGGPPGSAEENGDRFIEIWNLVFMQYNRQANGDMQPLPKPSVDTGMGLERVAAVMQHVHSNYDIDLFQNLLKAAAKLTATDDLKEKSLRVIADHIRSCAFMIVDGVLPSNEGRGYVLRRIIRRAVRHGNKLGCSEPFFNQLTDALVIEMGDAYPELVNTADKVKAVLLQEEKQFSMTLNKGMLLLKQAISNLQDSTQIPGEVVFKLHDTYGFPTDLTDDIAREQCLSIDLEGFEQCMKQQRNLSQSASKFAGSDSMSLYAAQTTEFVGYEQVQIEAQVLQLFVDGISVDEVSEGKKAVVVLDRSTFYAESGGQVGDCGLLSGEGVRFEVQDCQKQGGSHLHFGQLSIGQLTVGQTLTAQVDSSIRQAIAKNHSATHLLHAALQNVLGDQITQQGSLVNSQRLRFDFSHNQAVTLEQIQAIELMVNKEIRTNSSVQIEQMNMTEAKARGAMALFSEKYGDEVRVLTMGNGFSVELCGGIHTERTGDIGQLKIVSESGVAAGVRRIEAITGVAVEAWVHQLQQTMQQLSQVLKTNEQNLLQKTKQVQLQSKEQEKQIEQLNMKLANSSGNDLTSKAVARDGYQLLATAVPSMETKALRMLMDQLKDKLSPAVIVLASVADGKVVLVTAVSKELTGNIHAGKLLSFVAGKVGGKGGGRPDMAQGGGTEPDQLPGALAAITEWLDQS